MQVNIIGQVGEQILADGASQNVRQARTGEIVVTELHGRFYEQTFRGRIFGGGMQLTSISNASFGLATATSQTLATAAGATPILGLWNPPTSGLNAVLLKAVLNAIITALQVTGPGGFSWLGWSNQQAITLGAQPWNRKTLLQSGSVMKDLAGVALTGLSAVQPATTSILAASSLGSGPASNLSTLQTAAGLQPAQSSGNIELHDGSLIVPPGGLIGLFANGTPVAISASGNLVWEEVTA